MAEDREDLPEAIDVVIWHMQERDGLDVYQVRKGTALIGEFTGRSIGASVYQSALEHLEADRVVWLKDEQGIRRLIPFSSSDELPEPPI